VKELFWPHIYLYQRLSQLLDKESTLLPTNNDPSIASDKFDSLIILDRRVDMITPLLTQLTYEGLIDELVGIKNCERPSRSSSKITIDHISAYVELPQSVLAPPTGPGAQPTAGPSTSPPAPGPAAGLINRDKKKKHNLSASTDPLFEELRDLNFSAVGKRLNKVAHRLDEDYKVGMIYSVSPAPVDGLIAPSAGTKLRLLHS